MNSTVTCNDERSTDIMPFVIVVNDLFDHNIRKVKVTYRDGHSTALRLFKSESGTICYFARRSRKTGYHLPYSNIVSIEAIKSRKTPEQKWEDAWSKVIARLEVSGLWENVIEDIRKAFEIGYDKMQEAYKEYGDISYKQDEREGEVKAFLDKYPKLRTTNEKGMDNINISCLWDYYCIPTVKKMRFTPTKPRRYAKFETARNEEILNTIQGHMDRKEKYRTSGQASYDVSFEYNPDTNRAWYSEEYRGCGNGHYYIALDATHALFSEDD